ncbi:MAG: penicillin-binding protein 1C [Pyramidobacter sp.]|jgi:penicillin-binding protein 1C
MKRRSFTFFAGLALLGLVCAGATLYRFGSLAPIMPRLSAWPRSAVVCDRNGAMLCVTLSEDGEFCLPVLLSDMGRWLPEAVIQTEDRRFRSHHGIDWFGIVRAIRDNLSSGGVRSGASTITSQIIRLCWPAERTVRTKLREFLQAWRLENRLSKDQILEVYLNMVPLGSNLRGAEAASLAWFGRSARDLTIAQAALLACMIKGPTAYRPDFHPRAALERRNYVIALMKERGVITADQARLALGEPLPRKITPLPSDDLLFCQKVIGSFPQKVITSTLDRSMQKILRGALSEALASQSPEVTAAGVIIENATGAVRAYVANARHHVENTVGRWVDCADSPRSPGSTLKPFVYAMGFEDGTLTPNTLMADTPLTFSGRAPRNFDRTYRGPVSAANALVDSLNVPAVRILRKEGGERFLQKLRLLGFDLLTQNAAHYGDSLVLGGCEVTPLQLCAAVTALARRGRYIAPRLAEDENISEQAVYSAESAWIITSILADPARTPTLLRSVAPREGQMAFKTGTSYGLRDAWTAGWNDRWSVVVWLGDPTGAPHPQLVGLSAAAPAVLQVMRALPQGNFAPPPEGVGRRKVCSLSGLPPSELCPHTVNEFYIRGVSPAALCPMHRLDKGKVVILWPQELSAYMESPYERRTELVIASPLENATYLKHEDDANLVLRAEGSGRFYWYIDDRYVGSGTAELPCLWPMEPGKHRLTALDSMGRQKTMVFSVSGLENNPSPTLPALTPIE